MSVGVSNGWPARSACWFTPAVHRWGADGPLGRSALGQLGFPDEEEGGGEGIRLEDTDGPLDRSDVIPSRNPGVVGGCAG